MTQQDAFAGEKRDAENAGIEVRLRPKHVRVLRAILIAKKRMALDAEAISGDTEALAEELNVEKGVVSKLVSLLAKEEAKGGAVRAEEKLLDLAEQYLALEPVQADDESDDDEGDGVVVATFGGARNGNDA